MLKPAWFFFATELDVEPGSDHLYTLYADLLRLGKIDDNPGEAHLTIAEISAPKPTDTYRRIVGT